MNPNPFQPSSVLITGGAGFVGSHLALAMRTAFPKAQVVCMDNLYRTGSALNLPRLREAGCVFHQGDIRDRVSFPEGPFDLLLECSAEPSVLAGYGEGSSLDYLMQTNLMGTYECLERCRLWGAKIIFFSTSRVYPMQPLDAHPWIEEATRFAWRDDGGVLPGISSRGVREEVAAVAYARSLYGFTKFASELLVQEYRSGFGLSAVVNRCGVIAGPWQMGKVDQGVVGLWVLRHHFGRPLQYIGYGGTGKQVRDVLHVADLADLVERQIREYALWDGWVGNIGGGLDNTVSLCELTEHCREVTGKKVAITPVAQTRTADLRIFISDCHRVRERFGWQPQRNVRDIVADVHQWVAANEDAILKAGIG